MYSSVLVIMKYYKSKTHFASNLSFLIYPFYSVTAEGKLCRE